jgi:alpha-tubulin suppressor-like RCC1 family protein
VLDSTANPLIATQFSTYESTNPSGTGSGLGCAVKADHSVWCWGSNYTEGLGSGNTNTSFNTPSAVQVVTNQTGTMNLSASKVYVDAYDGYLACAIDMSSGAWCWGYGNYGALGNGYTTNSSYAKKVVTTVGGTTQFTGVSQMAVVQDHACALKTDGTVWCWGSNGYGQLGIGSTSSTPYTVPQQVTALGSGAITQVMVQQNMSCAVDNAHNVWCWGYNYYGEVGIGTTTPNYVTTPAKVETTDAGPVFGGVSMVQTSANYYSTCALVTADSSIWCWGNASSSQGYTPQPYTESSNAITAVALMCDNGGSYPSFIDYQGHFHFGGSPQPSYQISCP